MAVLLKNGAVFLHIPKTGGSWVTKVLQNHGLIYKYFEHIHAPAGPVLRSLQPLSLLADQIRVQISPYIPISWKQKTLKTLHIETRGGTRHKKTNVIKRRKKPFLFCFVRHPLRWYESFWKYQIKMGWPKYGDPKDPFHWHPCSLLNEIEDHDFNRFMEKVIYKQPGFVTRMYGWYIDGYTDFVGKQENLRDDLIKALKMTGISLDREQVIQSRVNESPKYDIKWSRDIMLEVTRLEYPAIKRFGYDER